MIYEGCDNTKAGFYGRDNKTGDSLSSKNGTKIGQKRLSWFGVFNFSFFVHHGMRFNTFFFFYPSHKHANEQNTPRKASV